MTARGQSPETQVRACLSSAAKYSIGLHSLQDEIQSLPRCPARWAGPASPPPLTAYSLRALCARAPPKEFQLLQCAGPFHNTGLLFPLHVRLENHYLSCKTQLECLGCVLQSPHICTFPPLGLLNNQHTLLFLSLGGPLLLTSCLPVSNFKGRDPVLLRPQGPRAWHSA